MQRSKHAFNTACRAAQQLRAPECVDITITGSARASAGGAQQFTLLRGFAAAAAAPAPANPAPRAQSRAGGAGGARRGWGGLLLLPSAVAALLGKWQLDRRQWKADLLQRREEMLKEAPIDLFAAREPPEEYRRVTCRGRLDHARTAYVGPRVRLVGGKTETGFLAVTPLRGGGGAGGGRAVLVNRGWVPAAWREAQVAGRGGSEEGEAEVEVEGVVRCGEDPGAFVPANEPAAQRWFFLDPPGLAAAAGLPEGSPLVEVITGEEGTKLVSPGGAPSAMDVLGGRKSRPRTREDYPLPKSAGDLLAFSVMPRDHVNYAATWFTLSGATAALAVKALRRAGR